MLRFAKFPFAQGPDLAEKSKIMAHQSNVIQVGKKIEDASETSEAKDVIDPVCGMKVDRKSCRHMLFRPEDTYYFCSKDCQQKFMTRGFKPAQKAA
ncbi:MAG: YHS domain-containing protein [Bdellovibrionia bacterium]